MTITLGRAVEQVAVILPDLGSFTAVLVADDGWAADAQVQLRFSGGAVVWTAVRLDDQMRWDRTAADVAAVRALPRQSVQLTYQASGVEPVQWGAGLVHPASRSGSCTGLRLGGGAVHTVTPPGSPGPVHVLPVAGPPGPAGQDGTGTGVDPALEARLAALEQASGIAPPGYTHTQSSPAELVQIVHGLSFRPAGVTAIDTTSRVTEPATIAHPQSGVTEIGFGAPFAGVIYLS